MAKTPPLEKTITKNIIAWINSLPRSRARKLPGSKYGSGWPDIVAVTDGTVLFIEVKRPKPYGTPVSELQRVELQAWSETGAACLVSRSVEDVQDAYRRRNLI